MHYWSKLKSVINPVDNMYSFTRDKSVLERYFTHKESIVNLYDYLMKLLFKNGEKIVRFWWSDNQAAWQKWNLSRQTIKNGTIYKDHPPSPNQHLSF